MSVIPQMYLPPTGGPLYWRNETSGRLAAAVAAYYAQSIERVPVSAEDLELVRAYLEYYIHAPCWNIAAEGDALSALLLIDLRNRSKDLKSPLQIRRWLGDCLDLGIDPL